jgi:hypothetical protein
MSASPERRKIKIRVAMSPAKTRNFSATNLTIYILLWSVHYFLIGCVPEYRPERWLHSVYLLQTLKCISVQVTVGLFILAFTILMI